MGIRNPFEKSVDPRHLNSMVYNWISTSTLVLALTGQAKTLQEKASKEQCEYKFFTNSPPQNYGTYSHNFVVIKLLALPSWFMIPFDSGSYSRQLPKNSRLVSNTRSMLHTSVFHIRSIRVQYIVIPF